MRTPIVWALAISWGLAGFAIGGSEFTHHQIQGFAPIPLTADERAAPSFPSKVPPMLVDLIILPHDEFVRRRGGVGFGDKTVAWSQYWVDGSRPCRIYLEAGMTIWGSSSKRQATLVDENRSLEHELLHCIRGDWHEAWP